MSAVARAVQPLAHPREPYPKSCTGIYANASIFTAAANAAITAAPKLFTKPLMLLFVEAGETEIIAEGMRYLHIEGAFYCGIGCLFLLYGLYRAVAKPGMSVVLTVISLGTRVVLAYLLSAIIGVTGIWWSVPIGWFLADVTGVVYYFIHKEKLLHFGESNLKRTES